VQLNVAEWGSPTAPPVVCLHGLTGHALRYERLARAALGGRRVIGIDLRGHGHSTWEPPWGIPQHLSDVIDTLDALDLAEALARADTSFGSVDEAIDARLADGTLFTTPRATLEDEVRVHLVEGPDGRLRPRVCAEAAIVAWSEMATAAPPWPGCPTLVVLGERSWIPVHVPARSGIETVRVPGGHSVLWDNFDPTAAAVARFLASSG
jgi:lipase